MNLLLQARRLPKNRNLRLARPNSDRHGIKIFGGFLLAASMLASLPATHAYAPELAHRPESRVSPPPPSPKRQTVRTETRMPVATPAASPVPEQIASHPTLPPAQPFQQGNRAARRADWSGARDAYAAACRQQPRHPGYHYNLAISLEHLGQPLDAARHYLLALQLDTTHRAGFDHRQLQQHLAGMTVTVSP